MSLKLLMYSSNMDFVISIGFVCLPHWIEVGNIDDRAKGKFPYPNTLFANANSSKKFVVIFRTPDENNIVFDDTTRVLAEIEEEV